MPDRRCDRLCMLQENLEKYKLEVKTVQMHSEDVGWQRVLFVRNRWKNHPYPITSFNKHEQHPSTHGNHLISDLFQKKGGGSRD